MTELTLYTNPMSRGRTARWMCEEIAEAGGPQARIEILDFGPAMKAPEYLAINPMGKVPALVHGDTVVTEVAAICAYLADAFPQTGLAPDPGSPARGSYYRWMFFAVGPFEAALVDKSFGVAPSDPQEQGRTGYGSLERVLDTLDSSLTGVEHVAGGRFTAADLVLAASLGWAMMFGLVEPRPALQAYVGRHGARPAALAARARDDALMPADTSGGAG